MKGYYCHKQTKKNKIKYSIFGEEIKGLTMFISACVLLMWGLWQSFVQTIKDDDVKDDGSYTTISLMICMATVIPQ